MSETGIAHSATGATVYAIFRQPYEGGKVYHSGNDNYEAYATAQLASYAISCAEEGTASRYYSCSLPMSATTQYSTGHSVPQLDTTETTRPIEADFYAQAGGTPAEGDTHIGYKHFSITWYDGKRILEMHQLNTMHYDLVANAVDAVSFPGYKRLMMILTGLQKWFRR